MQLSYKDKYDLSQFGKKPDNQLAKEYGISRERIRQIRLREGISVYKFPNKALEKQKILIAYLKKNKNNVKIIDIHDLKIMTIDKKSITKNLLINFAKNHKLTIKFSCDRKYEHGYTNNQYGCKCNICKLAKTIYQTYRIKIINNRSYHISCIVASEFANKYIKSYLKDKTPHKIHFYKFITKRIKKQLPRYKSKKETVFVSKSLRNYRSKK